VPERILIVEDEPEFAALVNLWMSEAGYETLTASSGNDALRQFYDGRPDLVVLDLAIPGLDGWQVIERVREFSRVPILIVTARSSETDKVRGLKLGADDYITKPLSFPELLARVEAALRRASTPSPERPRRIRHGDFLVDLDEHRARLAETDLRLTPTEFRLLAYLVEHAGQLATHRAVLGAVWGSGYGADVHLLRMTIRNLRMKLDAAAPGQVHIVTEYGLGYRLT
jgi:two-component system, OmpR family, KDP operon response regulator KdpE